MSRRVLLLSSYYAPQQILRWETAVKMKYEGTVDVLAEYDEEIRSPSVTWKIPAVVRLRRKTSASKRNVKFSRLNVYLRDKFTCQYCGQKFTWSKLTFDHVVPRSRGGKTTFQNVVTACRPCNSRKDDRTCAECGMHPIQAPRLPRELPVTIPVIDDAGLPDEWRPFLSR